MKKIIIGIFTVIYFAALLPAAQLPLKRVKLTSSFGESRKDHFHNGIDFGGGEQDIYPVMDGNIVFYYDRAEFPFDNDMGSGNMVIVQHDDRYRSYYFHIKEGTVNKTHMAVTETNVLGRTGDTGHSYGIHLHFSMEELNPLNMVNPLKFFKDQMEDRIRPTINGYYVRINESQPVLINGNLRLKENSKIVMILKCFDLAAFSGNRMGVYRIETYVNDKLFSDIKFEKLLYRDNTYYLPPNLLFQDLYLSKDEYILGEFTPDEGSHKVKIKVSDYWGNESSIERDIIFNKAEPVSEE